MLCRKLLPLFIALLALPFISFSQVTTSGMTGIVKNKKGDALIGASIRVVHDPTGTVYTAQTLRGGRYEIANMNPGGPYTFEASYVGYETEKRTDLFLILGENSKQDVEMKDKNATLGEVTVVTARGATSNRTGTETNIGRDKIDNLPTVGRNLNDYVRFTPQTKINANGGISIAGQNVRYNAFMIDGAVNNDVFGLSDQGTNGGLAGVPPISMDAIDQITVQISPFDASIGNFTGGGINAITRSGTNKLQGSVYYYFRNQNTTGKTPGNVPDSLYTKQTAFTNKTFGFRLGGPIIKNKLFFFLNAERQDDQRPQPTTAPDILASGYNIRDSVAKLKNFLQSSYGYDPGDYINNPDLIKRTNINARFDWNVDKKNKITLSYGYTKAERFNPSRSSSTFINFFNTAIFFPSTTHRGALEWNTKFTNRVNNKLRASVTDVVDDRGITGSPFPGVTINSASGVPGYSFGSNVSSTANLLKQRIANIFDVFRFVLGQNSIGIGADIDFNKTYNLFINRNFGNYTYRSLNDFTSFVSPSRYQRGYSLVDDISKSGDQSVNSAANFNTMRLGFFVNDDIKVNSNFTLTFGLRADKTSFLTQTSTDAFFRDSVVPVISKYYSLDGAESGKLASPKWQYSPRIGFRVNLPDEALVLRGGFGLFGGRTPLVWPGGLYQNNGVTIGQVDQGTSTGNPLTYNPGSGVVPLPFQKDVSLQYTQATFGLPASRNKPQGDMNLIAKNFKLPQVFKFSFGGDKQLGQGWTATFDLLYTKNVAEIDWVNMNFLPPNYAISSGPDKRMIYTFVNPSTGATTYGSNTFFTYRPSGVALVDRNPYSNIILMTNTTGKKGFSYNFTFGLTKAFREGVSAGANYTYGNSQVRNEGTSSINVSNWQFIETVSGRNFITVGPSDYDLGHRITGYLSKKFTYANKHAATTATLYFNGQTGNNFSYVYSGNFVGDGVSGNDLVYIPKDRAEMDQMVFLYNSNMPGFPVTSPNATVTAQNIAAQKDAYDAFIETDKSLRKRRGQYAERNGGRLPFVNQLDFKLQQDFYLTVEGRKHTLALTWDVFNFTNLLSRSWGRQYFLSNDQFTLVTFRGYTTTGVPQYSFSPVTNNRPGNLSDGVTPFNNSRWTSQIGVRYSFN